MKGLMESQFNSVPLIYRFKEFQYTVMVIDTAQN